MSILSKVLQHPIAILFFYLIGFWNIVYPSTDLYLYLGIFIVAITTINLVSYIKKRNANPVRPMCGYCGYMALDQRELDNHQITCEKKKALSNEKKD